MKKATYSSQYFILDLSSENPSLIHFIHPWALSNLLGVLEHLNEFRNFLGSLKASQVRSEIAKEIVITAADDSGIKFSEFEAQLRKIEQLPELKSLDGESSPD